MSCGAGTCTIRKSIAQLHASFALCRKPTERRLERLGKSNTARRRRDLHDGTEPNRDGTRQFFEVLQRNRGQSIFARRNHRHRGWSRLRYDTVSGGPRRKNVGWYLARDKIERVAIKRPHLRFASHIPPAVEFCRNVYDEQVKFDERFLLEDDRYYCAEFVDLAYRRSGLPMCRPMPINQLPNFREFSVPTAKLVEWFTSISPQQAVIMPGNESMGIWSSPTLQLVLSERNPASGPPLAFPPH